MERTVKQPQEPTFRIGDWVTQYSAGYWQVVNIIPKYADEDYEGEQVCWRKGEHIGYWVLVKKAFTPKMKLRIACECVDSEWCKPVPPEILEQIRAHFDEHPKDREKFETSPWKDQLAVASVWLDDLSKEEFERINGCLKQLPPLFNAQTFREFAREHGIDVHYSQFDGTSRCILYLFTTSYQVDEEKNTLYCKTELKRAEF